MISRKIYRSGSLLAILLLSCSFTIAQDFAPWPVPEEAEAIENPVEPNKASLEAGKSLYDMQCKACHGEKGKGDGLIKAADLTSAEFNKESDGATFWRLQEGRGQMPSFKALPEEQLWNVINYVNSLSKKRDDLVMKNAVIALFFNEEGNKKELTAKVEQVADDGTKSPAESIKVDIGVQRYFGILPVTKESNYTNEEGEVSITFPNDIIGDENGIVNIVASIEDMEYNPAETNTEIEWGQVNPKDYWSERRALWKNNEYVPLWLLASFAGTAIAIWLVIAYVALLVRKIKVEGDKVQ